MSKSTNLLSKKAGQAPGTLMYVGEKPTKDIKATRIVYNESDLTKEEIKNLLAPDIVEIVPSHITWLNISGLHDPTTIENIGSQAGIHPLALEAALNTVQMPRLEEYPGSLFIVLKILTKDDETNRIRFEQISIVLLSHCVISFQDGDTDVFKPVKKRLERESGRIRRKGSDYLAYVLTDTIVDQYYSIIEFFESEIEVCEEALFDSTILSDLQTIHELKRNILLCRKTLLPLRGLYGKLERIDSPLVEENTYMYFRDLEGHVNQVADSVESFREMTSSLIEVYHSNVSNRMNEVMKVLTIISTLFIPLSFVAGVYGMNFKYMPELDLKYGYPFVMSVVAIIAVCMILYFKRKKWL